MRAEEPSGSDWRDAAAYAPLLGADRSLIAWEWLRRNSRYRAACERFASGGEPPREGAAGGFGLVAFEAADLAVPLARPLWRADVHPSVLAVEPCAPTRSDDGFSLGRWSGLAKLVGFGGREHLLLSDGRRMIRLDGPRGAFAETAKSFQYRLAGLASAEAPLLTLRRLLALCRSGQFARSLHPPEPRTRRWILMLRAWDALEAGADQRAIAEVLLGCSAAAPRWRSRQPSLRSQAQRLVRSARSFADGGFRSLLL